MNALLIINEHKNKILNIAIIVLALAVSNNIYKSQNKGLGLLKEKKEAEIKKGTLLEDISAVDKKLDVYRKLLRTGKKDKFLIINNITNIAKNFDVKVESVKPLGEQKYPAYIKYPSEVILSSNDYHTVGQIISELENYNNEVYIIDSFTIIPAQQSQDDRAYRFNVQLRGCSLSFKD